MVDKLAKEDRLVRQFSRASAQPPEALAQRLQRRARWQAIAALCACLALMYAVVWPLQDWRGVAALVGGMVAGGVIAVSGMQAAIGRRWLVISRFIDQQALLVRAGELALGRHSLTTEPPDASLATVRTMASVFIASATLGSLVATVVDTWREIASGAHISLETNAPMFFIGVVFTLPSALALGLPLVLFLRRKRRKVVFWLLVEAIFAASALIAGSFYAVYGPEWLESGEAVSFMCFALVSAAVTAVSIALLLPSLGKVASFAPVPRLPPGQTQAFPMRHPTQAARHSLAIRLDLPYDAGMQDWEVEVASFEKFDAFLALYMSGDLSAEERFSLMGVLLQCVEEAPDCQLGPAWERLKPALVADALLHLCTISYWACWAEPDPFKRFRVSPLVRQLGLPGVSDG